MLLTHVVVKFGGVEYTPIISESGVAIVLPSTLARGTYDIVLTAIYEENAIRAAYEGAITIVPWNSQSDAQQFLPGSPIVLEAAYIIGGTLTDAELEELKAEFRQATADARQAQADAEAAKAEYDRKAEALDDVAKETTSQQILTAVGNAAQQGNDPTATNTAIKQLILAEGIEHAHEYAQEINEIIGDWSNE